MRFYWAIALVAISSILSFPLYSVPIVWPTASSRVGQDIYEACDSDMYIAEFLHSEHSYRCISTGARMFSPGSAGIDGEGMAMCSDEALLICLCGTGLGHCPSNYRIARYYVCSNPFEYPNSEPVAEAYDGPFASFIASRSPHDCTQPSDETQVDPSKGDSYGDSNTGSSGGGFGGGSDEGDGGSGGSGGGNSGDTGGGSVDPNDYDCAEEIISSDSSSAYISCQSDYSTIRSSLYNNGAQEGIHYLSSCGTHTGCSGTIRTPYYEGCDCNYLDDEAYWISCYSVWPSGCWSTDGEYIGSCTEKIEGPYYSTQHKKCSLSIPAPDGSIWIEEWAIPFEEACVDSCQEHRDNYSDAYPPSSSGPQDPEDYEDCESTLGCDWVGAPMGFGVCHCDSDDIPAGDEGTGPTSRSGRGNSSGDGGNGECGKGPNGMNCEGTQREVLSQVSELGENFENYSKNFQDFTEIPTDSGQDNLNLLGSQFEDEVNSQAFTESILNDPTFVAWKVKFSEHIQAIRIEASQLADSVVIEPPAVVGGPYGCLEFDFHSSHFGPECVSEHIQPALPYLSSFLDFLKYLLGFFILFRERS